MCSCQVTPMARRRGNRQQRRTASQTLRRVHVVASRRSPRSTRAHAQKTNPRRYRVAYSVPGRPTVSPSYPPRRVEPVAEARSSVTPAAARAVARRIAGAAISPVARSRGLLRATYCAEQQERRRVLHALGVAGRSGVGRGKRRLMSGLKCEGR